MNRNFLGETEPSFRKKGRKEGGDRISTLPSIIEMKRQGVEELSCTRAYERIDNQRRSGILQGKGKPKPMLDLIKLLYTGKYRFYCGPNF